MRRNGSKGAPFGLGLVLVGLTVGACGESTSGTPASAEPTSTQAAATSAPSGAPSAKRAEGAPTATESAATPAPTASAVATPQTNAVALPAGKNGILAAGQADKLLPVGGKPVVSLIDAGGEPRESLTYDLAKGQKESFSIDMDMTMKMEMGGKQSPAITMPRMSMLMDLAVKDKSAENDVFIDGVMTGVNVTGTDATQKQIADKLKGEMGALKGLSMQYWVSPKGSVRDAKLTVPAGAPAAAQQMMQGMMQSMDSMVAPLPGEPVGLGAKWAALTRVTSNGADFLQLSRYTLKARDGSRLTLDVEIEQVAAKASIDAPGLPPEVKTNLTAIDSGGKGAVTIDLKKLTPASSQVKMDMKMSLEVLAQGKKEEMKMEMGMAIGVGGKK